MKTNLERRCRECGTGRIRPVARAGRMSRHRTMVLEIPASLAIPTCDNCGAEWMDQVTARAIDAALEGAYREALRDKVTLLLADIRSTVPMRRVESLIGLSEGYLSKVLNGRSEPSAELISVLGLLARDVSGGIESLERLWIGDPPGAPYKQAPTAGPRASASAPSYGSRRKTARKRARP